MTRRLLRVRQDAGLAEEARDRVGRLGTLAQPLRRLLGVDPDVHGVRARVVVADRVERATVAGVGAAGGARPGAGRATGGGVGAVGDDDPVAGLLRRADARESDADCHGVCFPPWGSFAAAGPTPAVSRHCVMRVVRATASRPSWM